MTLKLQLSPTLERRLAAEASKLGVQPAAYALALLEKQLSGVGRSSPAISTTKPRRQPGSVKGLIRMADDFDAPLEDFELYR